MNDARGGDTAALNIDQLSKRFGGALALDDVSLTVARGEVHGLLGSNGSGKSTLIKVLAGFHTPEPGARIALYGQPVPVPVQGSEIRRRGLAFVHQNLGLIPSLSVTENLDIGTLATRPNWAINWRRAHARAADIFARFDLSLDPRAQVASLGAVEQALLAILRAFIDLEAAKDSAHPGVLILDEPTPFLPRAGVDRLFDLVRRCTATGASVIFVSHDVDEVRALTDRCTILRDGRRVDTVTTAETDHTGFVQRIVGRTLDSYAGAAKPRPSGGPLLKVSKLAGAGIGPIDLTVAQGEILGLTGLIGAGYDRVPALLYGAAPASGHVTLGDQSLNLSHITPETALQNRIAYLPADRLGQAGVGSLSVGDNVAMPVFETLRSALGLSDRAVMSHAAKLGAQAGVKPNAPALPLSALSGGNAQKAVLAKWLQTDPVLLLLDEPTQGVDVGARQAIWNALDATATKGAAIIVASTDYEQLAQLCHRVLIFARGQIVAELHGAALTKDAIAEHCFGAQPRSA